ncbi:Variant surface glycoprotein [Trypanosoma congolense IL3000]|uniref:Variant surface glycoprotein n=1 Tax=Trypanosoma congolense (strain IL3000) TaxID=1068625 RepID=F9WFR3_TRYCI|nr:Variant surface glycoprotein [Trypanosoma congolense IL3000]
MVLSFHIFFSFSRRIDRVRGIMKSLMAVMVVMWVVDANTSGNNHNGDEHGLLCDLLRAATTLWNSTREHLHKDLQDALKHIIFGEKGGEEAVNFTLPDEYQNPRGKRKDWCGTCSPIENLWPGYSASHDLICLCTFGMTYERFPKRNAANMLCGASLPDMGYGSSRSGGWTRRSGRGSGYEHAFINATWTHVVGNCLRQGDVTSEESDLDQKVEDLKQKLHNFTGKLKSAKGYTGGTKYKLGGSNFDNYQCSGEGAEHICVEYPDWCGVYDSRWVLQKQNPWWKRLNETLNRTASELIVKPTTTTTQSSSENPQASTESSRPPPPPVTNEPKSRVNSSTPAGHPKIHPTESNVTTTLLKLNMTSGTPITQPLWLAGAVLST